MGRVEAAGCVALERTTTDSRVEVAGVVQERIITEEGVPVDGIAALLTNRSCLRQKRKADDRDE